MSVILKSKMDIEESEIKIEYNESFESDPLRDDSNCQDSRCYHNLVTEDLCENTNESAGSNDDNGKKLQPHGYYDAPHNHNALNTQEKSTMWFQSKDSNGKLLCKFCELRYSTVQTLRHHVKNKHPDEAKILCKIIMNNKRNCKHMCHICKKRFKDLFDLKSHMMEHSIKLVQMSCMHCNAMFNSSEDLTEHIYTKHQKGNKIIIYMCQICGYRTLKKSHYQQHSNTHKENKDLICEYCDYKTNYSPNLRILERIHTNDKPYSCDFKNCVYQCAAKSALRSHQLKHYPKENMLFCDKCSYSTVYKQSLKKHLDSHKRNLIRTTK